MDAVPVTMGQEFGGYAAQISLGRDRVEGRSAGSARSRSAGRRRARVSTPTPSSPRACASASRASTGLTIAAPLDHFEAQANRDALVETSGALKVVAVSLTKIANDLRWMGSGPARRSRRAVPARAAEGQFDHAGQGQPGDPGGLHAGRSPGDRQRHGGHDRRHVGRVRAERVHPDDGPQRARVDRAPDRRDQHARGEVRRRPRGQPRAGRAQRRELRSRWPPR